MPHKKSLTASRPGICLSRAATRPVGPGARSCGVPPPHVTLRASAQRPGITREAEVVLRKVDSTLYPSRERGATEVAFFARRT